MNMARRGRGSPRPRVCPAPFGVATLKRESPGAAPRQPRSSSHLRVGRSAKLRITSGRAGNAEGWKAATSTTSPRDGPLHRWHIWGTSGGTPGGHIWGPSAGSTAGGVLLCGELEEWFPSSHERRQGGYVLTLRGETKNIGLEGMSLTGALRNRWTASVPPGCCGASAAPVLCRMGLFSHLQKVGQPGGCSKQSALQTGSVHGCGTSQCLHLAPPHGYLRGGGLRGQRASGRHLCSKVPLQSYLAAERGVVSVGSSNEAAAAVRSGSKRKARDNVGLTAAWGAWAAAPAAAAGAAA